MVHEILYHYQNHLLLINNFLNNEIKKFISFSMEKLKIRKFNHYKKIFDPIINAILTILLVIAVVVEMIEHFIVDKKEE